MRTPTLRRSLPAVAGGRLRRLQGDIDVDVVLGARRMDDDGGYVLAFTGLLLIPLTFFVAMAIDLGAWYAQASRLQRAADAAALAGVVWMPQTTKASAAALSAAKANGYSTANGANLTVAPGTLSTDYIATISAPAPRFFSQVLGMQSFNITRTSAARFNTPIPLGSPTAAMGNDVSDPTKCPQFQPSESATCKPQPMLWSSINGPYEAFANGDPYSTKCARNNTDPGDGAAGSSTTCDDAAKPNGAKNDLYKPGGYRFAIEVTDADIGKTLKLQSYDIGTYPRSVGSQDRTVSSVRIIYNSNSRALRATSSNTNASYRFSDADVGATVTGPGIPAGTTITSVTPTRDAIMSRAATFGSASATITLTSASAPDCARDRAPFTTDPYNGTLNSQQNCQTGDRGNMNTEVQVYENDEVDLTVSYATKKTGCRQLVLDEDEATEILLYKNKWADVCEITAAKAGIYPVTVKSSNIASDVPDFGTGINSYALRVLGGTSTSVYALEDLSIFTNTPSSDARFYLANIPKTHRGKRLILDLYDPGDGSGSSAYKMQVLAPPSGSPSVVPTSGTQIPADNIADLCRFNDVKSATKGPLTPQTSDTCTITTKDATANEGKYNASWLRIEIPISSTYDCDTDCWWSIKYDFGTAGLPTDRTVWSIQVVGDPVHLIQ